MNSDLNETTLSPSVEVQAKSDLPVETNAAMPEEQQTIVPKKSATSVLIASLMSAFLQMVVVDYVVGNVGWVLEASSGNIPFQSGYGYYFFGAAFYIMLFSCIFSFFVALFCLIAAIVRFKKTKKGAAIVAASISAYTLILVLFALARLFLLDGFLVGSLSRLL